MKILLFGGSFDPIHNGHIQLLKHVSQRLGIHKVILIPAQNAHFGKQLIASNIDRLYMLKLALEAYPDWTIDEFEINQAPDYHSYTYLTIEHFKQVYPQADLHFLIGDDQLLNFDQWQRPEWIANQVKLIVVQRNATDLKALLSKYHATLIDDFHLELSSTMVRNQLQPTQLPNPAIFNYIISHGLYHQCWLEQLMQHERYLHVVRVASLVKATLKHHAPELIRQGWIAGLYHDLAKNYSNAQQSEIFNQLNYPLQHPKVIHGPVAAYVLQTQYHLEDQLVLNAIIRHTLPFGFITTPLTMLDKVLYCCDKLEVARTADEIANIDYFRDLLKHNVDQCFEQLFASLNQQEHPGGNPC